LWESDDTRSFRLGNRVDHYSPAAPSVFTGHSGGARISSNFIEKVRGPSALPQFSLLEPTPEERKRRRLALGFSPAFEALAICTIVWALMSLPRQPGLEHLKQEALILHLAPTPPPVRRAPVFLKKPPMPHITPAPVVPKVPQAEIHKPRIERLKVPAIRTPNIELAKTPPAPVILHSFEAPQQSAKRQVAMMLKTGAFTPGSSAAPTIKRPLREVQTGGFGADNGIPNNPDDNHSGVAQLGAFDLPSGPGQGNGTGGAHGVQGVVASAGFGNAVGSGAGGSQNGSSAGSVGRSGFGDVVATTKSHKAHAANPEAAFTPAVILSKPDPVYPAEARQLHLEGEVVLSVVFQASGKVDVQGVVQGLGHGMDEAAIGAAEQIRFKPAERNGRPVDSKALVHIIFQLAY
jgi:TonB family protein